MQRVCNSSLAGMLSACNQIDVALQAGPEIVNEDTRTRLIQIRQLLSANEHLQHNRVDQVLANLNASYIDPELSSIAQKIKQEALKLQHSEEISAQLVTVSTQQHSVLPDSTVHKEITTQYRKKMQETRPSNLRQDQINTIDRMVGILNKEISKCKNNSEKDLKVIKRDALLALKTYAQTYSIADAIQKIEKDSCYSNFKAGYFRRTKAFFNDLKQECQNSAVVNTTTNTKF